LLALCVVAPLVALLAGAAAARRLVVDAGPWPGGGDWVAESWRFHRQDRRDGDMSAAGL